MDAPFDHQPVALDTVIDLLSPKPGETFCDATIGGGGHAERVLEATSPDGRLLGIDCDLEAVDAASRRLARFGDRVVVRHGRFSELEALMADVGMESLDGLVLDLGVSSRQLDAARRGFSFLRTGPLDMRMDATSGETAAALLARTTEDDLADIIFRFGGERYARRVARSIKMMEEAGGLATTADLAVAVRRVVGRKRAAEIDPATRTFQAIRIAVNDEIGELERLLDSLPGPLAMGGRVVVISFHSLEDGLVKRRFADLVSPCRCAPGIPVCACPPPFAEYVTRRSVRVAPRERAANPRSRSAKVRAIRRVR